jgi:hypothetical protein
LSLVRTVLFLFHLLLLLGIMLHAKPLNRCYLSVTSVLWLAAWILTLAGLGALTAKSHTSNATGMASLDWTRLFFSLIVACLFIGLEYKLWLQPYRFCVYTLMLMDFIFLVVVATHPASSVPNSASVSAYLAGLIVSGMVEMVWLLAITVDPESCVGKYAYTECTDCAPLAAAKSPESDAELGQQQVPPATPAKDDSQPVIVASDNAKAKALYDYAKNDPREMSLVAGETIDVVSSQGNWWLCRRLNVDGSVAEEGHAPSNFLQKL